MFNNYQGQNNQHFKYNTNVINGYIASHETRIFQTRTKWSIAMIMVKLVNDQTGKTLGTVPVKSFVSNPRSIWFYKNLQPGTHIITRVKLTPYRNHRHYYCCGLSICGQIHIINATASVPKITNDGYVYGVVMSDRPMFYPAKDGGQVGIMMIGLKSSPDSRIRGIVSVKSFIPADSDGQLKTYLKHLDKYDPIFIKDSLSPYTTYSNETEFHNFSISVRKIYTKAIDDHLSRAAQQDASVEMRPRHVAQTSLFM